MVLITLLGQAGAIRLGISKALGLWDRNLKGSLRRGTESLIIYLFFVVVNLADWNMFIFLQKICCSAILERWSARSPVRRRLERNTSG